MLRVRISPKALRAVGGSFFKLWESKEKLTGPNTLPAVHKTKGLRNSRDEPAHPRWRKEAGERGKGQTAAKKPSPPTRQTGPRFLSKDFLRPDRRRALGPQREKAHRTRGEGAQASGCRGRSPRREKARRTRGEGAQASGCPGR